MKHTQERKQLSESFPLSGKTRAKQNAAYLGIAESTFWKYCSEGKIKKPTKYGQRVSVWDASYIRELAQDGIPDAEGA